MPAEHRRAKKKEGASRATTRQPLWGVRLCKHATQANARLAVGEQVVACVRMGEIGRGARRAYGGGREGGKGDVHVGIFIYIYCVL